jgi:hypothetical protein
MSPFAASHTGWLETSALASWMFPDSCHLVYVVGCSCHFTLHALFGWTGETLHRACGGNTHTCACALHRARLRGLGGSEDEAASHSRVESGGACCEGLPSHVPSIATSLPGADPPAPPPPPASGSTMRSLVPLGTCRATSVITGNGPAWALHKGRETVSDSPSV